DLTEVSLDDDLDNERFSTVALRTPSLPPSTPDPNSAASRSTWRNSLATASSGNAPTQVSPSARDSRRMTMASIPPLRTASTSNFDFALARLNLQREAQQSDPSVRRASLHGHLRLKEGFDKLHEEQEKLEEHEEIDWDFWGEVMADYELVARTRAKELSEAIQKGIPAALRGTIWQLMSASKDMNLEQVYAELLKDSSPHEKSIMRDLGRTFPNHEYFQDVQGIGQENLFNVVKAYSLYDPEVGYCQGMPFVVAALLLNMPDEEAFCVLVRLMKSYDLRGHFLPEMPGLQLRLFQFDRLVEELLPLLHQHFVRQGVKSSMYCSQWFLTLFSYRFPLDMVFRIFDIIFATGIEAIFGFALVLLEKNEDVLLSLKFDQILDYMKTGLFDTYKIYESPVSPSERRPTRYRADAFVQDAFQVKVSPFMLDTYAAEYEDLVRQQNKHLVEMDTLRNVNRHLSSQVKKLESSLAQLNTEHCDLVKQFVMVKLEKEEMESELVKYKMLYAETMLANEDARSSSRISSLSKRSR
ncbi:RabGAP/TBC, partial [Calocera viscosa TUFC12733]